MEKEHQPDSMATVNIKPEYPPSEVYSTSEPPPAYRQRLSNSVQIARIVAVTIVLSSFILGSFILASSWVSARAGCQQLEQLDAMLDKELALEGRRYDDIGGLPEELPLRNAHALHQEPTTSSTTQAPKVAPSGIPFKDDAHVAESKTDEDKLQKIDSDSELDDSNDVDSSDSEEDELDTRGNGVQFKLPVEFDLDDLAGAFLANNDVKGRMNCVVERRRSDPIENRFPFNLLQAITGKITGTPVNSERVAIICHAGDEQRTMIPEPASQVFAFPINGPPQMPLGGPRPAPPAALQPPAPRMPYHAMMPWDLREEEPAMLPMVPPRQVRVHVQRIIAIPPPDMNQPEQGRYMPEQNEPTTTILRQVPQQHQVQVQENDQSDDMQIQHLPMPINLSPLGISVQDLRAIQRSVQEQEARDEQQMDNDMQEVKTIVNSLAAAAAASQATEEAPQQKQQQEEMAMEPRAMPLSVQMVPANAAQMQRSGDEAEHKEQATQQQHDVNDEQRPHYVQPRSIRERRSIPEPLLHREKRVKRCACSCA